MTNGMLVGCSPAWVKLLRISHQRMDNEYMNMLRQHSFIRVLYSLMAVADPN